MTARRQSCSRSNGSCFPLSSLFESRAYFRPKFRSRIDTGGHRLYTAPNEGKIMKNSKSFLLYCVLASLVPSQSYAHFGHARFVHPESHGWVIRDPALWRGGRWYHGTYAGALGWWWIVGATWYFYEKPLYPYPATTVAPAYYLEVPAHQVPASVAVSPPPTAIAPPASALPAVPQPIESAPMAPVALAAPPPAPAAPALQYYYCSKPAGYYPNVAACPAGWIATPAMPNR